jgi:hypothetical protein
MGTSLQIGPVTLPTALVILATIVFLALERVFSRRQLPHSSGLAIGIHPQGGTVIRLFVD